MRPILSASNLHAAALCPAKPRLEAPFAEDERADAEKGTDLHTYFRTGRPYDGLPPKDQETIKDADRYADEFIVRFKDSVGLNDKAIDTVEHEIELTGTIPGHPDYVLTWCRGEYVAVLDFKSGFVEIEDAPDNYQLAAYALLLWERAPFSACGVAIIQPNAFGPRLTQAIYRADQMPGVKEEIERIRDATLDPDAQPVAGEVQCRFCRAKAGVCPAYREKFSQLEEVRSRAIETITDEQLIRLHEACSFAAKISKEVSKEMRARVTDGRIITHKLQSSGDDREVTDSNGMYLAFKNYFADHDGWSAIGYDTCRSMVWGRLEAYVQRMTGLNDKRAKELVKEISAPFVVSTPKAQRVVPIK